MLEKCRGSIAAAGLGAVVVASFAAGFGFAVASKAEAPAGPPPFTPLLVTSKTVMDEPIVYPAGEAEITAGILSLAPGQATGWHKHGVPLGGIVLEGEITVDYGERGTRTFKSGEAIMEAMGVQHRGMNKGDTPLRVFVMHLGAKGVPLTTPVARE